MLELKKIANATLKAGRTAFTYGGTLFTIEHTMDRQYAVMYERNEQYKARETRKCWECAMYIYA